MNFYLYSYSMPIKGIKFCAEGFWIRVDSLIALDLRKKSTASCLFSRGIIKNVKRSYTNRENFSMYQSCSKLLVSILQQQLQIWKLIFYFWQKFRPTHFQFQSYQFWNTFLTLSFLTPHYHSGTQSNKILDKLNFFGDFETQFLQPKSCLITFQCLQSPKCKYNSMNT